jgi:hypothetical protein
MSDDDAGSMVRVGDIISVSGPTVPPDLVGKFFRVTAVEPGAVTLSLPYLDAACQHRYHPERQR